jgi:hypothetical protein
LSAATRTGITQFVAIFVFIGLLAKIRAIGFGYRPGFHQINGG